MRGRMSYFLVLDDGDYDEVRRGAGDKRERMERRGSVGELSASDDEMLTAVRKGGTRE